MKQPKKLKVIKDKRKCPRHNYWMRKDIATGIPMCEQCRMEAEALQRQYEKTGGKNKPPVRIGTINDLGKNNEIDK